MENLIKDTEAFVNSLLTNELSPNFLYHNLSHTQRVVQKAQFLAEGIGIDERDTQLLILATWFHDTGHTKGADNHEKEGVKIASTYLKEKGASAEDIKKISDLIMATKIGHKPKNVLEKIICDADCAHMGSKNYGDFLELLRKEWELTRDHVFTEEEWLNENIDFLINKHQYHTSFANSNWEKIKGNNLARLLRAQNRLKKDTIKLNQKKDELDFKKRKVVLPERGIETMFRVALRNHITLSDIADTKANILLSVNAIIMSLALSSLIPKLDNTSNQYLIIPTVIFVVFTVISIVLSVMATRPNVTSGQFSKQDVADKKVNLLFFGNFHKMSLDEFEWAMGEMMQDRDYLYGSLTKDLYYLGLVLNRKYSLLRITYSVFIIGIIVSVISFAVAFKMQSA